MIRGINRRIIEVNDTGSDYFEKALFFVKSDEHLGKDKLESEARKILLSYFTDEHTDGYLRYSDKQKRRKKVTAALCCAAAAAIAAVLLAIFL